MFPTSVGVNRNAVTSVAEIGNVPHVRGGEPDDDN